MSGERPGPFQLGTPCRFRYRLRLFRKPPVRPPGLRHFWVWLRTSSSVIVSSCC